ncbi:D-alanyl-D-alanine carboxypeptidase (penicillin-binding protein 5/6) [Glaciihabitans tibetensis]|uniref:D-alanyl-D-alanine carboxypeptidase (Penicillin-binding protein 5/6) n=1 Tax=Glaciihabitans tibetensis TaxID=1266600 RepID=A0A2T0VJR9_9MICO|nr:D-alanyl-D-alanine carboxypeptidase (penicillin-binding protein 5/6) [Glaciihabitans tibetensis]
MVVLAAGVYLPTTLLAPLEVVSAELATYTPPVAAAAQVAVPAYGASGIAMVGTEGLLASGGNTAPLPIASVTKVVTALVVLNAKPLASGEEGEDIAFTSADVQIYNDYLADNGSVKPVAAGEVLTQREVLELMLVGSANNYARSLVNWAFGSEAEYAAAAATWLTEHGMTSTSIVDSTGMSPLNTSTPTDLVALGGLALADPTVAEIVSQKSVTVPDVGSLSNTNSLLGVDGIDGIKTGTLDEAGACLLFSADVLVEDQTVTLVGVVLGGEDHDTIDAAVRELISGVISGFHKVTLTTAGESFGAYSTAWGETTTAVASEDSSVVVWSDTPVTATVATDPITVVTEGSNVGTVTFVAGSQQVSVPLTATTTIEDPGAWWRITHPEELF